MSNGKGKGPEKGRNLSAFRDGYANIKWSRPHPQQLHELAPARSVRRTRKLTHKTK